MKKSLSELSAEGDFFVYIKKKPHYFAVFVDKSFLRC